MVVLGSRRGRKHKKKRTENETSEHEKKKSYSKEEKKNVCLGREEGKRCHKYLRGRERKLFSLAETGKFDGKKFKS